MIKFLIISILLLTTIHSDSIENYLDESLVDCDSLFIESNDKFLGIFLIKNDLFTEYERRNDNYKSCFHFLGIFFQLIDQYRTDEYKDYVLKFIKK